MSVYGWSQQVYLRHSVTGGEALVADEPGVVDMYEAKGWARADVPAELDPDAPNTDAEPAEQEPEPTDEALKGKALDEALDAAGLPKTGSADEKRQRLADLEATSANNTQEGDEVNG